MSSDQSVGDSVEQLMNYLTAFAQKNIEGTQEPLFDVLYGGEVGISGLLAIDNGAVHAFLKNIATTNM
ncbi:hypothetical protein M378DRAFT_17027 [Amanita muscaria Koide BX008]|uniref:Uncharacterized protein n=1 Tax=Amanita muscaria (strain Koide BX008) TaxID=946122 RepID=A0A0C2W5Y1_AMAMK|nr:hypothetical protein M378DRAFT_17027 [Amanita muscaria Koide BX008]